MEYELGLIRQLHPFFWKNNVYFGIYLACLLILFLARKKEGFRSIYRAVFWYSIVTMIVVCYNPIFTRLTFERLFWYDMSTYVRVFLILPIFFTVAYVAAGLIGRLPRIAGDLVLCALVVVIVLFGETPAKHEMYRTAENPFKINSEAVQISDMIDAELEDGERCYGILPRRYNEIYGTDLVFQGIRQYDSNIIIDMTFPVMITEEEIASGELREKIEALEEEYRTLQDEERDVYFICLNEEPVLSAMETYGYRRVGSTNTFTVMTREA